MELAEVFASNFKDANLKPFIKELFLQNIEGSICVKISEKEAQTTIINSEFVGSQMDDFKPFIFFKERLYFQRYFAYESEIVARIKQITAAEKFNYAYRFSFLQQHFSTITGIHSNEQADEINLQQLAIIIAYLFDIVFICGGPGTGKTTTVANILNFLFAENDHLKVALTAPTGKAAARMAESLKQNVVDKNLTHVLPHLESLIPNTIHRLLGSTGVTAGDAFKFNKENPLPFDVIIVDESSMIDIGLFAKLLNAVGQGAKILFLGDKDQLSSVEAGTVLGDICALPEQELNHFSKPIQKIIHQFLPGKLTASKTNVPDLEKYLLADHIVYLTKSYRFNEQQGIGVLAKAVIQQNIAEVQSLLNAPERFVDSFSYCGNMQQMSFITDFLAKYETLLNEPDIYDALKKMNAFKILTSVNEGIYGVENLNIMVEQTLKLPINGLYNHKPIMITRSDNSLGVLNGDTGLIKKDAENHKFYFYYLDKDGHPQRILLAMIAHWKPAYAMTIHKSQGSEFDEVLVVLGKSEHKLLTVELIYTAITRAKQKLYLLADESMMLHAIGQKVERISGIRERLNVGE